MTIRTRILSSVESPVHHNWKDAIMKADSTDTVFLNRSGPGPALRALRTDHTTRLQKDGIKNIFGEFAGTQDVYFGGNLEAGIALTGQVAGRITEVKPVKQIFDETLKEFDEVTGRLAALSAGQLPHSKGHHFLTGFAPEGELHAFKTFP